jgi:hypothetical protein
MKAEEALFYLTNLMANHLAAKQAFCDLIKELCPTPHQQIAAINRVRQLEGQVLKDISMDVVLEETAFYLRVIDEDKDERVEEKNEFFHN